MSNYYVTPGGSDGNGGLQGAPFATIQKGINAAQPGDAITLQGRFGPGQTCNINKAGSQGAPITLLGQGATLDGQGSISRWVDFQGSAAWWIVQDLEILGTLNGGVWANSGGAQNITCRNLHIHNIGGVYDSSTYGIAGIYTDSGAVMRVEGCYIHSIGRTGGGSGGYDHGIYSHALKMDIVGNQFADTKQGWHIQTAAGFSGSIQGNSFDGPNQYPGKDGQIMLWGACGPIDISGNAFNNIGGGAAIIDFAFSSPQVTIGGNSVSGGTLGGPAGAVFGSGSSPAPQQQSSGGGSSPVVSTQGPNPLSGVLSGLQGAVSGISPTMLWVGGALLVIMLTDD